MYKQSKNKIGTKRYLLLTCCSRAAAVEVGFYPNFPGGVAMSRGLAIAFSAIYEVRMTIAVPDSVTGPELEFVFSPDR